MFPEKPMSTVMLYTIFICKFNVIPFTPKKNNGILETGDLAT